MTIIIFLAVCCSFYFLHKIFISEDHIPNSNRTIDIILPLPRNLLCNDLPEMNVSQRERARKNTIRSAYLLGAQHANSFRVVDKKDKELSNKPYYYLSNNQKIYVDPTSNDRR